MVVPRNGGRPVGSDRWAWIFLGFEVAAFTAYVVGVILVSRRAASVRVVVALAVAIQLAPLGAPLLLSSDAWTYWDYGRIAAVDGGNPYRDQPDDYPHDPAFLHAGAGWRDTSSVYGPAFTLASEPLALAAGSSANAAAWLYKSLAALTMLGVTALAWLLSPKRLFAVVFVGWNPLLAVHFAGGGHNDAWMALLVLGALALAAAGRRQLAGAAWALAALIKWVPLVFLPLRALEARANRRPVAHAGFAMAAAIVTAAATVRYGWHWLAAIGPLARNANRETRFAIPHRMTEYGIPHWAGIAIVAVVFVLGYAWLARQAWGGRARLGLAAALLLLTSPYLVPWYTVWAVPLAAVDDDRTAQWVSLGLSAYLLRQTILL